MQPQLRHLSVVGNKPGSYSHPKNRSFPIANRFLDRIDNLRFASELWNTQPCCKGDELGHTTAPEAGGGEAGVDFFVREAGLAGSVVQGYDAIADGRDFLGGDLGFAA